MTNRNSSLSIVSFRMYPVKLAFMNALTYPALKQGIQLTYDSRSARYNGVGP